ncbi:DUF4355 domain-containing protein [Enterococcus sp. BWB1-3]|uniref:DUF4355 domain-containing protein n=1 Tax=Enterococcus sp. BWB1-3 TaxID=2787713 RepID=UPI001922B001|nr:DUF4355 domain-containing protein [Enterococcus sp. BWB1-3]MBL1228141.1 DUF4355 domain-containing protein [Enterococcus sp. BWB1-3]
MKTFVLSKCKDYLELNLQLFTDGSGGDGAGGEPGGSDDGAGEGEIKFSSQSELDSYIDKKLEKSLTTARNKWDVEAQERIKEAERKGKMTAEEQAKYELDKEKEQLAKERQAIQRDRDETSIIKRLTDDQLPSSLSKTLAPLCGGDPEQLEEAYKELSKSFQESVEEAVNKRLAHSAGAPGSFNSRTGGNEVGSTGQRLAKQNLNQQTESKFFNN